MLVPGATMMSEQECSKQLKKPVIVQKGKHAGKQAKDKNGNLLWHYVTSPDLDKYNRHDMVVESYKEKEHVTFYTRKSRPAKQSINMSTESYEYFIGNEVPQGYRAPKSFKPTKPVRSFLDRKTKKWVDGTTIEAQAWKAASKQQRLEWHLRSICSSMGGILDSYTVFND